MFESVKQESRPNAMSYSVSLLFSIIVHAVILGAMISLPLIFYSPLNSHGPVAWLIDSPILSKKAPPPPPPSSSVTAAKAGARPSGIVYESSFVPPRNIPKGIPAPVDLPDPGMRSWLRPDGGVGIGIQEAANGFWIDDLLDNPTPDLLPPKPPDKPKVLHVVSELQESKLIYRVNPVYPSLALQARVSGTVVLAAVIDEEGSVTNLKVLSGHPLLNNSAVEAVSQWKYLPTILNGEPVSVSAVVTVIFRIQ